MRYFLRVSLLFFLVAVFPMVLMAEDYLSEADARYQQEGMENYKRSIDLYLKALEADPNNYEANWKCARACRDYGEEAKKQCVEGWKRVCAQYGKEGMKYAQKAIERQGDLPDGHYYYGLSVGTYSDGVSILTALKEGLKNKTQHSFETAYKSDRMYDEAGPILALGRFWAVVPWPFKDKKKALRYYREFQQTRHFADKVQAKVYLAELLLEVKGAHNKAEAKGLLEEAAQSGDRYFRDWAHRLLTKIKE